MQTNYSTNFVQTSLKQRIYKAINVFSMTTLVLHMSIGASLAGVLLVSPEAALACHGYITIAKDTGGVDSPEFTFSSSGGDSPGNFTLHGGEEEEFGRVVGNTTYTISETDIPPGWSFDKIKCDSGSYNINSQSVSIYLHDTDNIKCTFYNTQDQGPGCGDGTVNQGEECDDGNTADGDGCSANCTIEPLIIKAYKVVCEDETYLPNWGAQSNVPAMITDTTASDWVAQSNQKCWLESDWDFQWGFHTEGANLGVNKLPGDHIGPADGSAGQGTDTGTDYDDWKNFDTSTTNSGNTPAGVSIDDLEGASKLWVRENLKTGYEPYANPPGSLQDPVSAEIYCHTDTYNFDNYDRIDGAALGETYYCVAFNALVQGPECGDGHVDSGEQCDDGNDINTDDCRNDCTLPVCGDGIKDANEQCDDGNKVEGDGCNNNCEPDGTLIVKKVVVGGTATSSNWTMHIDTLYDFPGSLAGVSKVVPVGMHQVTETGGLADYDLTYGGDCGDTGLVSVNAGDAKTCILTNTYNPPPPPACGDGHLDQGEECDDGNNDNGDGCSSDCKWQGILIVRKIVGGGTATSSDWTMDISQTYSFPGDFDGTSRFVVPGMHQVTESGGPTGYNLSYGGDCGDTGLVAVGTTSPATCVLTNTYVPEPTGSLTICKYYDYGVIGTYETATDTPLAWDFWVASSTAAGPVTVSENEETGCVTMDNLPLDDYHVTEVPRLGGNWINSYPQGGAYDVSLTATNTDPDPLIFLNHQTEGEPFCGDGIKNGNEECDGTDGVGEHQTCTEECTLENQPYCGDGHLDPGEQCDDGNNVSGDGCSATCHTEGGGGGGGGGGGFVFLTISNLNVKCLTDSTAAAEWFTNKAATSWMVYGTSSNAMADATSTETTTASTHHEVTITGLTPGVNYTFEAVANEGGQEVKKYATYSTDSCVKVKGEEGEPILVISKAVAQDIVNPGDKNVEYTITVTNEGNLTSFDTIVVDTLPTGLTFSEDGAKEKTWELGDLEPGDSREIIYYVDVSPDAEPKVYINTAVASSSNYPPVSDTADVNIEPVKVLAVTGFDGYEFMMLLMFALASLGSVTFIKKYAYA